jgi:DNA-binding NtrC family response regulator
VDDDPQFCKTLGDILETRGFTVTQVTDPQGALERIGAEGQVVLLDMKLDTVSSLTILQEIRNRYPDLPVVLVTGYREEMASAITAALKISAYTCLYKPLRVEELLKTLAEINHWELGRILRQNA